MLLNCEQCSHADKLEEAKALEGLTHTPAIRTLWQSALAHGVPKPALQPEVRTAHIPERMHLLTTPLDVFVRRDLVASKL